MTVWVGTSGWQYRHWRGRFYPEGLPRRQWLEHYTSCFDTVEVNNTFYRLPEASRFQQWHDAAPAGFVFALKMSRFLTHVKRLRDPDEPVRRFLESSRPLGAKTGPVLVQLPPNLPIDLDRLERFLGVWPRTHRLAVELRHRSWLVDDTFDLLRARGAALVLTDRDGRPQEPLERTANFGYLRLHHGAATPRPCYGEAALQSWVDRVASLWAFGEDVYVYFNNDPEGCAVRDAAWFAQLCRRAGLHPSAAPDRGTITVGPRPARTRVR